MKTGSSVRTHVLAWHTNASRWYAILSWSAAVLLLPPWSQYCRGATVTYRDGNATPFIGGTYSGTRDAALVVGGGNTTDNLGARGDFEVGVLGAGAQRHALVRFDVTSLAGQYSSINGVTLRLYPSFVDTVAADAIQLYRLAAANTGWVEGNGTSFTGFGPEDVGGSTWSFRVQGVTQGAGTPWAGSAGASSPGVDYLSTLLASTPFTSSTPLQTAFDLVFSDVSFIGDWAAGNNPGLFLKSAGDSPSSPNARRIAFTSREGTAAFRPELIIDYNVIPEPAGFALGFFMMACLAFIRTRQANR
jgi:hypothetical protein